MLTFKSFSDQPLIATMAFNHHVINLWQEVERLRVASHRVGSRSCTWSTAEARPMHTQKPLKCDAPYERFLKAVFRASAANVRSVRIPGLY